MRHILFEEADTYPVAVLTKHTSFNKHELITNYISPLNELGIPSREIIAFTLKYNEAGKAPTGFIKEYLSQLLIGLNALQTQYLYVADSNYFKVLTGQTKAEPHHGYVLPCKIKGFEHMQVVLGINHQALIYDPSLQTKLNQGLQALADHKAGTYTPPGSGIIHSAQYPEGLQDISDVLASLHQYPRLSCDIEGFSLRFNEAGIGTIAFAWDEHNGIAFACDYSPDISCEEKNQGLFGYQCPNEPVRQALRDFFLTYQGEITWHNSPYDLKAIIYNLWMKDLLDTKGMLTGLDVMTHSFQDTKIIAYLATNSTAGNTLGLKALAHGFAGNWAKDDIKDIRKIPLNELLQYNIVDTLSTWYVKKKYTPVMVQDNQLELYQSLMLPSLKLIIQMELTGMPMSKMKIAAIKAKLEGIQAKQAAVVRDSVVIKTMEILLRHSEWSKDFAQRQAKAKNPDKILPKKLEAFDNTTFNPNSGPQLQRLLYEVMGLPVLDYTDTKQPATGADTISKLINHTQEPTHKELLAALIAYGGVSKILNTFIPAFEGAISKDVSDTVWLHGSFNLGGTVSGRLSSSDPNLQNIPANVELVIDGEKVHLGKLVKEVFVGPDKWIFCGADFSSLEDRINALLTKDPQKLKVYTDGYDSHSLRAQAYFPQHMPDIRAVDESENLRTFKIVIDGQTHLLIEGDFVKLPDGTITKVESLCL